MDRKFDFQELVALCSLMLQFGAFLLALLTFVFAFS